MLYADVCVNTPLGARPGAPGAPADSGDDPLGRTFTYAVPDRLAGRLEPGHLAWVPFRGRRLQAVVLRVHDAAPQFETREIISLVWAQPLLTPSQLELAAWVSDTYLSPLIDALRLMLPAGLAQRGRTVFVRTRTAAPAGLPEKQKALLARITQAEGDWAEISQGLKGVTQRDDLEPLIEMKLVSREVAFASPPPRAKTDRQVRLLADAETVARVLPALGKASKQADALAWLAGQPSPTAALADLCAGAGCTPGPVKELAKRGWVEITPAVGRGQPAPVTLRLPSEQVSAALIELRGAEKHRSVLDALAGHDGPAWIGWVYANSQGTLDTLRDLEAAGLITLAEEMVWRDPLAGHEFQLDRPPELTDDQQRVWQAIRERMVEPLERGAQAELPRSRTFLLHGVTGSGKTEIYLRAIAETLAQGRQAIVLVPEIALTPQTIRRFAARFPGKVTVWHSELGEGERFDVWRRVRTNHPAAQVVVGSRSALFLPFDHLGVIVLDEEHEPSYKQERTPRYHARTAALELARICEATLILGSATPALETYYAARRWELTLLTLAKRIRAGEWSGSAEPADSPMLPLLADAVADAVADIHTELPPVHVVDMRQELRTGNRSMFSRALANGLRRVLGAGQQAILYLNRRGAASSVLCRDCGHVETCARCSIPLTYHGEGELLVCHHCNRRYPVPVVCPQCGGKRIRYFGAGTERVEEAVRLEFPQARTLRWDRDVTGAKGSHDAILTKFIKHEADVLIGTQMIAKGLDLPLVTLVGVVAADTGLFLPDFRAAERTFQLLTQVAGRAGRSSLGGDVVVQTYQPDHYAILAASNHDYEGFYRQEMAFRREQNYPPIRKLARLVFYHGQRAKAQEEAQRMAKELQGEIGQSGMGDTDLIGPAPCFFARERSDYRWQVIVRGSDPVALLRRVPIKPGWRVDIDPVDLL
jgi:primosomal protein N' (replication factor Y) (superfamily II helicase)